MSTEYLKTAVRAGMAAGQLILGSYGKLKNSQIKVKTKNDFVTEVDKKSEALILSVIKKRFPGHAFQAEESGCDGTSSDALWVIDPLDGTANYIHQFPMFSISISIPEADLIFTFPSSITVERKPETL